MDLSGVILPVPTPFQDDKVDLDRFRSLGVIQCADRASTADVTEIVNQLKEAFAGNDVDKASIVSLMQSVLPSFRHAETGKNLDQRM